MPATTSHSLVRTAEAARSRWTEVSRMAVAAFVMGMIDSAARLRLLLASASELTDDLS